MIPLSVPRSLWDLYVEYLWDYKANSWVASAASTFRVLAFMALAPFIVLTLLDVTSYVIARTLGVVDHTKASTSSGFGEPAAVLSGDATPAIVVQDSSIAASDAPADADATTVPPPTYFRNPLEEHGNLELSGVGTFSPAPSQPPSPTLPRREHNILRDTDDESATEHDGASGSTRPRQRGASTASSSGESFALLEHDAGADESEVTMRRRTRPRGESTDMS